MDLQWYFKKQQPGDTTREPIQGEFFATEAIHNPAEALVREGIQNSIDARQGNDVVHVRIYLSGKNNDAIPSDKIQPFVENGWNHFTAERNGLKDIPPLTESCPFLVFEDFGTTGLSGDPKQWHKKENTKNAFFTFFRAEGLSDKAEHDLGRWGVGKFVFPRSSRISSFFGLTVRDGVNPCLLMGRAILKSHHIEDTRYVPDGYFGGNLEDGLLLPLENSEIIKHFSSTFNLKRGNRLGLSIVVPWYDQEINGESLIEAVLRGYFFPVLTGSLVVTVETSEKEVALDENTIIPIVKTLELKLAQELTPLIELAKWGKDQPLETILKLNSPPPTGEPEWNLSLIPDDVAKQIREALKNVKNVAVRIPLNVREKGKESHSSFFDIYLVRTNNDEGGRPVFVREGIIISDIRSPRVRGIRSLVVVEDEPLATMLGDSENPAHTQWQRDGSNFKGKYIYGPASLKFVINSVSALIHFLTENEREVDPTLAIDYFSLPALPEEDGFKIRRRRPQDKDGNESPPPPPKLPLTPKRFRLNKVTGGFSISHGDTDAVTPRFLVIRAAYDIRRGNPLKKYDKADFEMDKTPIKIASSHGIHIMKRNNNEMIIDVRDSDFDLTVTGFDEYRDIFLDVKIKEEIRDYQEV